MKLLNKILSTDDTKRKWTAVELTVIIAGLLSLWGGNVRVKLPCVTRLWASLTDTSTTDQPKMKIYFDNFKLTMNLIN